MSNNLVSQQLQLPTPSMQMGQLEPIVNKVDSSGRDLPVGFLGPVSSGPMSQQVASNDHVGLARAMPGNPTSHGLSMSVMQSGPVQSHTSNLGMHQPFMPNRQSMQMETMMNSGPQQTSVTPKRKAPMEPLSSSSVMPNKKVTLAEHRPWLQQISPSNKGAQQSTAPEIQHLPALSKRKTQMEPSAGRSGGARSSNSKGPNAQMQQSSKVQTESFESVRSKMRESLAAALAMVSQQDKTQVASHTSSNDAINAQGKLVGSSQCASSAAAATDAAQGNRQETTHSVDASSAAAVSDDSVIGENRLTSTSNEGFPSEKSKDGEAAVTNISSDQSISNSILDSYSDRQDFQLSYALTTDDVPFSDNFFVKDELLQGNGLSWVLESDIETETQKDGQINEELRSEPEKVGGGENEQSVQSPELLGSRIEAELFKLFGGVNKKYKEKGRSLLFNLKDRNNPELRERVMSGEIPPERLCSMTAEELASKELSQWRIAKAEELAQMVVLPNSDLDVRRLVKKTHKGEYQVEVEHDDKVSVEVSGGVSSVSQSRAKRMDAEAPSSKPDGIKGDAITGSEKSNLEKDNQCALTIPSNDGADPMQGLMADDALKDADFLPPIVSLDEFMESLHSEPPFENLAAESEKASTNSDKDGSKVGPDFKSSDFIPSYQVEGNTDKSDKDRGTCSHVDAGLEKRVVNAEAGPVPSETKCGEIHTDSKSTDELADVKPTDGHAEVRSIGEIKFASNHTEIKANQCHANDRDSGSHLYVKAAVSTVVYQGECIWEGTLQLSISATHPVMGIFKSGEKTSVKDWPGSLEIKGRVRLDAFDKFLQELPLSRTRAVMVVQFVSKEESPRNEHSALREVADSYIVDQRVGFAEPVPRVELYFCPPHRKTVEMLSKIVPKEQIEEVNAIDFGLIGLIVWRKTHVTSTVSPTSSSHHKHSSKKQYLSARKQRQDSSLNSSLAPKPGPEVGFTTTQTGPSSDDDDDDIPPGFGPAASRDEDDLPEFNFSGGPNPLLSNLVQKPTGPGMAPFHTTVKTISRPVENLRELVHKYGHGQAISSPRNWQDKSGVTIQPWNDDDDDIPEWQPHAPQNQYSQQHNFQPRGHMANQSYAISQQQKRMLPMQSLQPPMNVTQRNIGPMWASGTPGNDMQPSNINYGVPTTQGKAWHQNDSRSRGF